MQPQPPRTALQAGMLVLVLAGCAATPLPADTAPALFGGGRPIAALQPAPPAGPHDGLYTGQATIDVNMDYSCSKQVPVGGFRVDGNAVRFGGFRGDITPDGSALLLFGKSYMRGQFSGNEFHGSITLYPALLRYEDQSICVYKADLTRVAG